MADKTPLRVARETARLSRQQLADMLDTTVHHYWQCEMDTAAADPELTAKAWQVLGGTSWEGGTPPQGRSKSPEREALSGPSVWVCPTCNHEDEALVPVLQMEHTTKNGTKHQMKRKVVTE